MDITAEVIQSFIAAYTAFAGEPDWPDSVVTMALCEGDVETGGRGWGAYVDDCHNFKQRGMFLFAAHWLSTTYPAGAANPANQSASANYAVASKSVGDESIGFNNGGAANLSAGDTWLAAKSYGQQFMRLRRRAGIGAIAI